MESLAIFFFVIIGGWIWHQQHQSRRRLQALASNGVQTQATIINKFTRSRPKSGKRGYIEYEFEDRVGALHSRKQMVTAQEFLDQQIGDRISVIYDPNDVEHNRPLAYLVRKGYVERDHTL
jgi:hypothetical protein